GANPVRHLAVALAETKRLHWAHLDHLALLVECRRSQAEPSEHVARAKFFVHNVQGTHTVEQRDNRGLLAYCRRERLDRILELVGLAAQPPCIKLVLDSVGLDDRRILQRYVAIRAFDHKATGGRFRGTARAHQKGDVATSLQHPAAEVSANGSRANDENAHLP